MKKQADEIKEVSRKKFNNQADKYDSTSYSRHARGLYDIVLHDLSQYSFNSLLDVGCGTGNLLCAISRRFNVQIAGIDLSSNMLEIAHTKLGDDADLRLADSENLPFHDNSFDVVICTDSFHHYPHPANVLNEFKRVLTLKGKVLIADPYAPIPVRQLFNLIMPHTENGDVKMYSKKEIHRLLLRVGFNNIKWDKIGLTAFIVTASKNKE